MRGHVPFPVSVLHVRHVSVRMYAADGRQVSQAVPL